MRNIGRLLALFAALSTPLLALCQTTESKEMKLMFCDSFDQKIGPEWTVMRDEGTTVAVADHWLACEGSENRRSHVQAPLNVDMVTVSAAAPMGCDRIAPDG